MSYRRSGLLAGALALLTALALVPAAGATPATVRIVGDAVGIEPTLVETTADPVGPNSCPGDSAGGAIDKAVNGNWDKLAFTQRILGELHDYSQNNDYWTYWINDASSDEGICDHIVAPGDRILLFVQHNDDNFNATIFPLTLSDVPASVVAGKPFTVTVRELRFDGVATTTPVPIAGATVAGGGASALTDAAGKATLTLTSAGQFSLRATRTGNVLSEAAAITVTAVPSVGTPPPPPPPPTGTSFQAPGATLVGIEEGQRFARGEGPRELKVRAYASLGLLVVKLRLTRNDRGRCSTFSGKSERFRHVKCGASNGFWFAVGDTADISYLLPSRLPRGRYVLDINTIDKAYNRDDKRRRGGNRLVFYVG